MGTENFQCWRFELIGTKSLFLITIEFFLSTKLSAYTHNLQACTKIFPTSLKACSLSTRLNLMLLQFLESYHLLNNYIKKLTHKIPPSLLKVYSFCSDTTFTMNHSLKLHRLNKTEHHYNDHKLCYISYLNTRLQSHPNRSTFQSATVSWSDPSPQDLQEVLPFLGAFEASLLPLVPLERLPFFSRA